jgi:tripartite-type tricarboxylate transporter receptor subunit TctC
MRRSIKVLFASVQPTNSAPGIAALPTLFRVASAQAYPTWPVRIIVPLAPGGGTDYVARLIAGYLTRSLGQQVVVENRTGAGGMLE